MEAEEIKWLKIQEYQNKTKEFAVDLELLKRGY